MNFMGQGGTFRAPSVRRRRSALPLRRLPDIAALESRLNYCFSQPDLLAIALTHVSALGNDEERVGSYQRLEFLGDRVLGLVVSEMLIASFPEAEEGELSRRLAGLVRRESCAEVALEWGADHFVMLGEGEAQTGGARKVAILGDICESVIGAVFLDGGYEPARLLVVSAFSNRMNSPQRSLRDAKTALQEWAQARGLPAPIYKEMARSGPPHAPEFMMAVVVEGFASIQAQGGSKRTAEQAAAIAFLRDHGVPEWSEV